MDHGLVEQVGQTNLVCATTSYKVGEANTPGPDKRIKQGGGFVLDIVQRAHFYNQAAKSGKGHFNAMMLGEHSLGPGQDIGIRDFMGINTFWDLSKLIPDRLRNVGGVGCVTRNSRPLKPDILDPTLKKLAQQGRVELYGHNIGNNTIIHNDQTYGVTNGDRDDEAAAHTNAIGVAIIADAILQNGVPYIVTGDFNASIQRLSVYKDAIEDLLFIDVGACASAYGGLDNEYTCQVNAAACKTRTDYVLACLKALRHIASLKVDLTPILRSSSVML